MSDTIDIRKLKSQNEQVLSSVVNNPEKKDGFWTFLNKDIQLGGGGLPARVKESFYMELWSLLTAGVDIRSALELVGEEQNKKKAKKVFEQLLSDITTGATLSQALERNGQFSKYEYYSVQVGEETGQLLRVLKELAEFFKKSIHQRRQIIGALTYPLIVLVVAFGAVGFMVSYVVPMFSDIFKRFGGDLPPVTKMVIGFSAFVKSSGAYIFLVLLLVVLLVVWQRKKIWFRRYSSKISMRIPVIGTVLKKIYLSRFANTMAMLSGAKIPMLQAIQLTRQMIGFYPIEQSLYAIETDVLSGKSLHMALKAFSVYPPKMISMIKVGEEVNQLELFFGRLAEQYNNEVEHQTSLLSKLVEPFIIIILGLVVGIILIAMYLPLFKLGQSF
jgi:type IV pilus assembly protein PilC